ncbi:hypothetical protein LTR66_002334 [Elasticomyces elasticus]|nr:hypothetical protein LTR66_002334 [Elasticomyces elasticus]KAK5011838.1 hypothetical protein LTR28_004355 [Elasticomyces elasticus]
MRDFPSRRRGWWARQTPRRRVFFLALGTLTVLIAVGVGAGVGVQRRKDNGPAYLVDPTTPSGPPPDAYPPNPSPNGTVWQPQANSTWQIVLGSPITIASTATSTVPDVDMFDIDLFGNSASTIATLHKLNKKVICYFSAGSYEPKRPDSGDFKKSDMGKELAGWPGEYWLDVRSSNVRDIMLKRLQLAQRKGCDGVDPDNMDGYANDNGLSLTSDDSIAFMTYLSSAATSLSLAIGLKNSLDIIPEVVNMTHFAVNEQCVQYNECKTYTPYLDADKPIFHIEYPSNSPQLSAGDVSNSCNTRVDPVSYGAGGGTGTLSTLLKKMNLDGWVQYCDGKSSTTPTES